MLVLVVYGSTRGGTAGLAHMVADALAIRGMPTEVKPAGDSRELGDPDAVIVGGALYSNRWHPDAVAFVGRHRGELRNLPVWFFSSGPLDDSARSGALAAVPQVSSLAREIDIRGHMTFGGLLDKRPGGLLGVFSWGPEGDFRDRHHVSEWVERVAGELAAENAPTIRVFGGSTRPPPIRVVRTPTPPPAPPPATEVAIDWGPELEWPRHDPAPHTSSRLRRYLRLDDDRDDGDDEGLDLFEDREMGDRALEDYADT